MRQPPGGVPDADISADTMLVARSQFMAHVTLVVVFWKKLRHDILSTGLQENAVLRALYIYQESGEPKVMLATHVDDMLWATNQDTRDRIQQLSDHHTLKDWSQSRLDSAVEMWCSILIFRSQSGVKTKPRRFELVRYDPKDRKQTDLASQGSKTMQTSAFITV